MVVLENSKKMKNKKRQGFSLIELEIIMVIMGILMTVGFVSLKNSRNQSAISSETLKVLATVQSLRSDALSGKNALVGSANEYIFEHGDLNGDSKYEEYRVIFPNGSVENYTLESGIEFEPIVGNIMKFSAPWADIPFPNTRRILLKKGSLKTVICAFSYGRIEERKGTWSCT